MISSEGSIRSWFSRFDDDLCETILSHLSLEDQIRCECVSKQFKKCCYKRVYGIDFRHNPLLYRRLKCGPPVALNIGDSGAGDGHQTSGGRAGRERVLQYLHCLYMNVHIYERLLRKCPNIRHIDFDWLIDFENYGQIVDTITRTVDSVRSLQAVFSDRPQMADSADALDRFYDKFAESVDRVRAHHRGRVRPLGVGKGVDNDGVPVVGHDNGMQCLRRCVNVTHLNVIYNIRLARLLVTENECQFRRLESLEFSFKTKDKKRLETLVDANHQSLQSVFVTNSGSLTPTAVYTLFTQLARCHLIRRLEISIGYEQRFDYNLGHLMQRIAADCPLLVKLTITLHFKSTELALQTFESLKHFRHVRRLFVSLRCEPNYLATHYVYNNTFFKCKPLNACRSLTHLRLADILINDIFFYNIDKHLPRLRYLYLFSCRNYYERLALTDISIKMLSKLVDIETIMFSERQPKITDGCVHDLIDRCPRIKRISFGNHSYNDRIQAVRRARRHSVDDVPPPLPPPYGPIVNTGTDHPTVNSLH